MNELIEVVKDIRLMVLISMAAVVMLAVYTVLGGIYTILGGKR